MSLSPPARSDGPLPPSPFRARAQGNHGSIEGEVERVLCERTPIAPIMTTSEKMVDANFLKLRDWRDAFEKRAGRQITKADLLLAETDIRGLARRMGLFD